MNAHIPYPVQKNITDVVVSITYGVSKDQYKPNIIVDGRPFLISNLKYQYSENLMGHKKDLCTLIVMGYFKDDQTKYGLIGNFVSGKFILADYNTFVRLATTDEGFDI